MSTNEDAALYLAAHDNANEVFAIVEPSNFSEGNYRTLALIIDRGRQQVEQANLADWTRAEVLRSGRVPLQFVVDVLTCGIVGTPSYWANKVRSDALRSQYTIVLNRGLQMAREFEDLSSAIERTRQEMASLPVDVVAPEDALWEIDEIMGMDVQSRRFTIPGLLARSERLVLTGNEGFGKSVLVYQLTTSAAFGINFLTQEACEPQRVMMVDVENSVYQQRDSLDRLVPTLREMRPDVTPAWASMKRRTIDLLATRERAEVIRTVCHYAPDILYMGSAYRLTDSTDDVHRTARAIQSTVDSIRAEIDCTVMIEHHAGHGTQNDRNGGRPEGSSFWMRWPEFGKSLTPRRLPGDTRRFVVLNSWRGNRTEREWPVAFIQSSLLPWRPVMADEFAARYEPIVGSLT